MLIFGTSKLLFTKTFYFQEKRRPETWTVEFVETKQVTVVRALFSLLASVRDFFRLNWIHKQIICWFTKLSPQMQCFLKLGRFYLAHKKTCVKIVCCFNIQVHLLGYKNFILKFLKNWNSFYNIFFVYKLHLCFKLCFKLTFSQRIMKLNKKRKSYRLISE